MRSINAIKEGFKQIINSKKSRLGLAVLGLAIVCLSLVAITYRQPHRPTEKVVYEPSSDPVFGEPTIHLPRDAKSAACTVLPRTQVESILKAATNGPQISIPDTQTKDGSVSGCNYMIADDSQDQFLYLSLVVRHFTLSVKAQQAFDLLAKNTSNKLVAPNELFIQSSGQLVLHKADRLNTLTIARNTKTTTDLEVQLKQLAGLL